MIHSITHDPERVFYESVILHAVAPEAHDRIHYQYPVSLGGRTRKIDFALIGARKKLALELDGFRYHAEGQISQSDFSDQLERQNVLMLDNWIILRFSWADVVNRPDYCINTVRRSLIDDDSLHPILASAGIRPHLVQSEALLALSKSRLNGHIRGLVVLPTGLGKTYLAAFDAATFPGRTLFVVHNNEVLEQASLTFQRVMPDRTIGLFNGFQRNSDLGIVCANVYSLHAENLRTFFSQNDFEYIIIDEFHHAAAPSYQQVLSYFRPQFILGLTATPVRTDESDIISILDNNVVYSMDAAEAIDRGFLVPFNYMAYCDDIDYSRIQHNGFRYNVEDLNRALIIEKRDEAIHEKYTDNGEQKAIGFCVSIEHADRMAMYFRSRGIAAEAVHSRLSKDIRTRVIDDFRCNRLRVVFVRDMFNEGVDFPDVRTLMFLRPTESKLIFMQQLGRGLRLSPEKGAVDVLDFIGNYQGSERVLSYLRQAASSDIRVPMGEKPVFCFDNGCKVTFTQKAIDAIKSVGVRVRVDIDIVKRVFLWASIKSRLPSFCDVLNMKDLSVSDIFSVYGCWGKFVARLQRLDDSWDYGHVQLPDSVSKLKFDEIAEFLDQGRGLIDNSVDTIQLFLELILANLRMITTG